MRPILVLLAALAGCEGVPDTDASLSADGQAQLDDNTVLALLTSSSILVSVADQSCQEIFAVNPGVSLASLVREQQRNATSWDASCDLSDGRTVCLVTLQNSDDEDREFFAEYRFELDSEQALIESTIRCTLAG